VITINLDNSTLFAETLTCVFSYQELSSYHPLYLVYYGLLAHILDPDHLIASIYVPKGFQHQKVLIPPLARNFFNILYFFIDLLLLINDLAFDLYYIIVFKFFF
jgi:hypothetical protein